MRVTVCQLHDEPRRFERDWAALVAHVRSQQSELVLLPELPFSPWFGAAKIFDPATWEHVVAEHQRGFARLHELAPAAVCSTRPVNLPSGRFNQGYLTSPSGLVKLQREKAFMAEETGFWETSWYQQAPPRFPTVELLGATLGIVICTELWQVDRAGELRTNGAQVILTPRAVPAPSTERWVTCARTLAMTFGVWSLSSNKVSQAAPPGNFGGYGWVIDPAGNLLGHTSEAVPFLTLDIEVGKVVPGRAAGARPSVR